MISSAPYYVKATNTVYVGANDGLLHAIDAANGNELFSYVPNALFPKLYKLTQPNYVHDYYVDGEIAVSTALWYVAGAAVVFVGSAYLLNALCFYLSFPALILLFTYSLVKRFSSLSHFHRG